MRFSTRLGPGLNVVIAHDSFSLAIVRHGPEGVRSIVPCLLGYLDEVGDLVRHCVAKRRPQNVVIARQAANGVRQSSINTLLPDYDCENTGTDKICWMVVVQATESELLVDSALREAHECHWRRCGLRYPRC
jgi:hypothetical protein